MTQIAITLNRQTKTTWNKLSSYGYEPVVRDETITNSFIGYGFINARFINCKFKNVYFIDCLFINCTFDKCIISNEQKESCQYSVMFKNCRLLEGTQFIDCELKKVLFDKCELNKNLLGIENGKNNITGYFRLTGCSNSENIFPYEADIIIAEKFDLRGYITVYNKIDNIFISGCRIFTQQQALEHWGDKDYLHPHIGKEYIKFIEKWRK